MGLDYGLGLGVGVRVKVGLGLGVGVGVGVRVRVRVRTQLPGVLVLTHDVDRAQPRRAVGEQHARTW